MTAPEPIMVACEGSGGPVHAVGGLIDHGLCSMCGELVPTAIRPGRFSVAQPHDRVDVLAMLRRGDFG